MAAFASSAEIEDRFAANATHIRSSHFRFERWIAPFLSDHTGCQSAQQEFTVWLEQDRIAAGMVNGRSHFPGGRGRQSGGRPGGR